MKSLCLTLLSLFFATANAASTVNCHLEQRTYSTADYLNYDLVGSRIISEKTWQSDGSGELFDAVDSVVYRVRSDHGSISGSLCLHIDQPGPCDAVSVGPHKSLRLIIEDLYNSGKSEYLLSCAAN